LLKDWKTLAGNFKALLLVLLLFTLGNSTDAFLMLRLSQLGVSNWLVALLWGLHGGVRMVSSLFGGTLSDRLGRKPLIISGWLYYALIYLGFALVNQKEGAIFLFLAYGVFYGLCEPSEKAFVADLAPKSLRGTAFGYYNLVVGLFALPASLIFGLVGQTWGYPAAFMVGAKFAGLASFLLIFIPSKNNR
jgi:MFS family permease